MNYKKGDYLKENKNYKCIVCDEELAVFCETKNEEGEEHLILDNISFYHQNLRGKQAPIEYIINTNEQHESNI